MEQQAYWMTGKINLDKVERKYLFKGKQGDFIDLVLLPAEGKFGNEHIITQGIPCLLYTSPSPRDATLSRMPSSA